MSTAKQILAAMLIVAIILSCGFLLPCLFTSKVRETSRRGLALNNLRQISLAFQEYHHVFGTLPPAVVCDKQGRPLYSWRVLLLPFLEEVSLYKKFKLDEPWDSPNNLPLTKKTPSCYYPLGFEETNPEGMTFCQVFTGPGTPFERPKLTFKDFPDGLDNTFIVVEASKPVPWAKPEDLVYDPKGPLPGLGGHFGLRVHFFCYKTGQNPGFVAAFADGSLRFITFDEGEPAIRAMITRNGGEK